MKFNVNFLNEIVTALLKADKNCIIYRNEKKEKKYAKQKESGNEKDTTGV